MLYSSFLRYCRPGSILLRRVYRIWDWVTTRHIHLTSLPKRHCSSPPPSTTPSCKCPFTQSTGLRPPYDPGGPTRFPIIHNTNQVVQTVNNAAVTAKVAMTNALASNTSLSIKSISACHFPGMRNKCGGRAAGSGTKGWKRQDGAVTKSLKGGGSRYDPGAARRHWRNLPPQACGWSPLTCTGNTNVDTFHRSPESLQDVIGQHLRSHFLNSPGAPVFEPRKCACAHESDTLLYNFPVTLVHRSVGWPHLQ